jgi:hypothetical protein
MIGMPEALAIMSVAGIIIAAIVKHSPSPSPPAPEKHESINATHCANCKAELTRRIDERHTETQGIFREIKKQGKQLARIEERLKIQPPDDED